MLLGLWFAKNDFMDLKNSIMKDISAPLRCRGDQVRASPARVVNVVEVRRAYLLMICSRRGPTEIHLMGVRILFSMKRT